MPYLYIDIAGKKGRGVFTSKNIRKDTVIEISPVIVLPVKDVDPVDSTTLGNYVFEWGWSKRLRCLALGYVSLYNHEYSSNCEYDMDYDKQIITIKTVKPVKKGEELSINYNASPEDKKPVWFHKKVKSPD